VQTNYEERINETVENIFTKLASLSVTEKALDTTFSLIHSLITNVYAFIIETSETHNEVNFIELLNVCKENVLNKVSKFDTLHKRRKSKSFC
jgi:hypothetical protein